jgi:hypothetical protein
MHPRPPSSTYIIVDGLLSVSSRATRERRMSGSSRSQPEPLRGPAPRALIKILAPGFLPLHNNHLAHAEIWCECLQTTASRPRRRHQAPDIINYRRKNSKLSVVSIIVAKVMPSAVPASSRRVGSRESCFSMTSSSDSIAAKSVRA